MGSKATGSGRPGKRLAVIIGALGLVALAASGFVFKDQMIERACLWRLESGDAEKRRAAEEWLSRKGSIRAVPALLKSVLSRSGGAGVPQALLKVPPRVPRSCIVPFS